MVEFPNNPPCPECGSMLLVDGAGRRCLNRCSLPGMTQRFQRHQKTGDIIDTHQGDKVVLTFVGDEFPGEMMRLLNQLHTERAVDLGRLLKLEETVARLEKKAESAADIAIRTAHSMGVRP